MPKPEAGQDYERVMIRDLHLHNKRNYWLAKRAMDLILSGVMLIVLSPLLLLIALLIKMDDGGPAIYSQMRCGRGGKQFRIYKFRTMVPNADKLLKQVLKYNEMVGPAFKMRDDPRITRVGKVLRKSNLDELPQLYNILKGEMSFVGPRPPLPDEVTLYTEYQFQRLFVTPGLTCYWQTAENRNDLTFNQWIEMDIQYVIDRSIWVDIGIVLKTVSAVFRHTGR